jgi:hypothetical protein
METALKLDLLHGLRKCKNSVIRKMFRSKKDKVGRDWRKLHYEELHDLYSLPIIIRIIKLKKMRRAEHVILVTDLRKLYKF